MRVTDQGGQASVECVALIPLIVLIGFLFVTCLAVGAAREQAGNAAEAGALAVLQDRDPGAAIKAALPEWSKQHAVLGIKGGHVRVELRPRLPWRAAAKLLTVRVERVAARGSWYR